MRPGPRLRPPRPRFAARYSGYMPSRAMAVVHARTEVGAKALGGGP
jgi:hypothetical protein